MTRKTDTKKTSTNFRTDRFFCQEGLWYFNTREGTVEGPYATRKAAEQYLQTFIVLSKLTNLDLSLEPTDNAPPPPPKGKRSTSKTWDFDPFHSRYRGAT